MAEKRDPAWLIISVFAAMAAIPPVIVGILKLIAKQSDSPSAFIEMARKSAEAVFVVIVVGLGIVGLVRLLNRRDDHRIKPPAPNPGEESEPTDPLPK